VAILTYAKSSSKAVLPFGMHAPDIVNVSMGTRSTSGESNESRYTAERNYEMLMNIYQTAIIRA